VCFEAVRYWAGGHGFRQNAFNMAAAGSASPIRLAFANQYEHLRDERVESRIAPVARYCGGSEVSRLWLSAAGYQWRRAETDAEYGRWK